MTAREQGFVGNADALWLARSASVRRPLIVITADAQASERLREEIAWFAPQLRVARLPDWETLPYDQFSPHPDLVSERLATLNDYANGAFDVGLVPVQTALQRLAPRSYLAGRTFFLKQKEHLDVAGLRAQMALAGYTHTAQVVSPGEFSIRGGIIDLYPMGSAVPYRIDLDDEVIDGLKSFDVDTQRSIYPVPEVRLLPAREFPLDDAGRAKFREHFRDRFEGDPSRSRTYKDVSNGLAPAGVECYLPLFFDETATLFDYLQADAQFALEAGVSEAAETFWRDLKSRYELLRGERERPLLPPLDLYQSVEDFFVRLKAHERVELRSGATVAAVPDVQVDRRADEPLKPLARFLDAQAGRVLIVAESAGRRETLAHLFAEHGVHPAFCEGWDGFLKSAAPVMLAAGTLNGGFALPGEAITVITEAELYPTQVRQSRRRDARNKASAEGMLRDLAEVREGDPVVHSQHGIARYRGLITMDLGEGKTEFLHLEYEGGDKLYVPVAQLHAISRYTGASPETAPLHRLGSGQWEKAKRKAAQQVRDTAAELLNLYAMRAAREGHAFPMKANEYESFAAGFDFEETPDQAAAIESVIADMVSGKPMDRLICGDVGFGKTEVAMRAAFVAVNAGKQVAILVPTTLLAEQHFQNFSDRFAEWPVKIAELSRFRSVKEIGKSLDGLADGTIDIVIGTHKLIQKDVKFQRLGLVIIDEEHRFGVRQKEELKALRAEVDVLTLTATPIPRTLAMSLEGLRDFSVIATAPQRRLSIKTFVNRLSQGIVREAVLRELKRGGQVYYLYNEVETIQNRLAELQALLPEARVAVAHGQLSERELERVMRDFYHQRANVLLCSTIIETGIDVPSANTILIHRADKFGLAQLHQLRGRVGRSHHQAYAYLLTPPEDALSANAKKRLEAIQMMEDLGAGFYLAMHDLEIRGAGEVLGESQSGGIHDIGFTLYTEMLEHAVRSLKSGKEPDLAQPLAVATEINLHSPALLPEDYCGDVHERLVLYKRLANCATGDKIDDMVEELVDRFGPLPETTRVLVESHRLRVLGEPLGVAKIDASPAGIIVQFVPKPPIEPQRIIALVQSSRIYKLVGPERIRIEAKSEVMSQRVAEVKSFFKRLGGNAAEKQAGSGGGVTGFQLVIQGSEVATPDLKALSRMAHAEAIERVSESAFRLTNADPASRPLVAEQCAKSGLDFGFVESRRKLRDFRLLAMDMDSTLITIECIDEIADFAGRKAEVAAITASAMRGEIDWPKSLRQRVAALAGLEVPVLEQVYLERLRLTPGAGRLLAATREHGIRTLLVSGGFTFYTERLRVELGLDYAFSNVLVIGADGKLAGEVTGPLVDAQGKAQHLARVRGELGLEREQVLAIGDGANDLLMMGEAGTSIAYHAKPVVQSQASYALNHSTLEGVLNLFPA